MIVEQPFTISLVPKLAKGFRVGDLKKTTMGITNAEYLQIRKFKEERERSIGEKLKEDIWYFVACNTLSIVGASLRIYFREHPEDKKSISSYEEFIDFTENIFIKNFFSHSNDLMYVLRIIHTMIWNDVPLYYNAYEDMRDNKLGEKHKESSHFKYSPYIQAIIDSPSLMPEFKKTKEPPK